MSTVTAHDKNTQQTSETQPSYTATPLLTAKDIADRLSVPTSTIYEAVRQERIGGIVRLGRLVRFDPVRFQEWIDGGGQALPCGWKQERI